MERLGLGGTETVLSDIQLAALAALERHESMTPGELAEHEKVQPPSMTRVIAVLEERGLVQREPHADRPQAGHPHRDRGRPGRWCKRVRRRREAWLAQRLQELTPEERADPARRRPDPGKDEPGLSTPLAAWPVPGDGKPAVIYPRTTGAVRTPDSSRRFRGNASGVPG